MEIGEVENGVKRPLTFRGTKGEGRASCRVGLLKELSTVPLLQDRTPCESTGIVIRATRETLVGVTGNVNTKL